MFALDWSHVGRGLCDPCYRWCRAAGELIDYEPVRYSRDELMAEWELLRLEGYSKRQAAARLDVTFEAFDRAFHRARAAGDPRAVPGVPERTAS